MPDDDQDKNMLERVLEPMTESFAAFPEAPEKPRPLPIPDPSVAVAAEPSLETSADSASEEPVPDWRTELSAKMQNYRTRRKPRAPKYPSLQIPLGLLSETPAADAYRAISADVSRSSNALQPAAPPELEAPRLRLELVEAAPVVAPNPAPQPAQPPTNLIEFPRSMESEAWDGLAEPVVEQPRILDAPELVPPAPALGGILLEAPEEANPHPAAEVPLRPASITRRFFAVIVDAMVVGYAIVVWGWIAAKITQEVPPRPQLLISVGVAAVVLWLAYQYLLMVYSGTTLGQRFCRLELVALDGTIASRKQRRWRWLASLLSAASLMLGYAWVLLDENHLCWHDRITHTYLQLRQRRPR
jgi:uncharacterized RDD family membrane protein YckC